MSVTTSRLPNRETFIIWPEFCLVVRKLHGTCQGWKRQDLDARYPQMCSLLSQWPQESLGKQKTRITLWNNSISSVDTRVANVVAHHDELLTQ